MLFPENLVYRLRVCAVFLKKNNCQRQTDLGFRLTPRRVSDSVMSSTTSKSVFESSNVGRIRRPRGRVRLDFWKSLSFVVQNHSYKMGLTLIWNWTLHWDFHCAYFRRLHFNRLLEKVINVRISESAYLFEKRMTHTKKQFVCDLFHVRDSHAEIWSCLEQTTRL